MPPPKLEKSINWESKYIATNLELSDLSNNGKNTCLHHFK